MLPRSGLNKLTGEDDLMESGEPGEPVEKFKIRLLINLHCMMAIRFVSIIHTSEYCSTGILID